MFTVCPKCALTLVVTAPDLRIAQGYVRCGRCLNVFNALARLSEERPPAALSPDSTAVDSTEEPLAAPDPPIPSSADGFTVDDTGEIEVELDASILVTSVRAPTAPSKPAEPEPPVKELRPVGPPATHVAAAASAPAPAAAAPAAAAPSAPASTATAASPPAVPAARDPPSPRETDDSSLPEDAHDARQTNTAQRGSEDAFELETRRPHVSLPWKLGVGALVIALALQVVNHYRDALAAHPALRGPLTTAYSALGVKLAPRWNIHAYDVRQLGASVAGAAAGEIVVRASVKNSASRAQPLPLLRVTLQDRFGNRIAARDVPPGDYLPRSVAPSSLLAAGGRVDATMVFVDPGPQAVGFEIDACLRQRSGEVACAHGPQ